MDKTVCITRSIVFLLHGVVEPLCSSLIARRAGLDVEKVQRRLPKLVRKGLVSRKKPLGAAYWLYSCSQSQFEEYVGRSYAPVDRVALVAQDEERVSRKLKFLLTIQKGMHADNPVLAEVIADYRKLRSKQAIEALEAAH